MGGCRGCDDRRLCGLMVTDLSCPWVVVMGL
ncbi:hypothetical protein Pint_15851 [Pistacia integerrima]|uniref:Uncharacterized protein n=1 Tax=Pistacia integerrima TaxID=434235 RepID=A0ACC0ZEK1_9ROSI|nr:hypothetical protein Pint_15851 [Pistacia integerrima]